MRKESRSLRLGIDVGSTTAKVVVLDTQTQAVLFSRYQRHHAEQARTVRQLLKEAAETRDAIVSQAQEKAREEGARLLSEAKAEIESQKQAAISEIRAQVAELSVKVAEKILRKELSSEAKQMETIDRLLDDISEVDKK